MDHSKIEQLVSAKLKDYEVVDKVSYGNHNILIIKITTKNHNYQAHEFTDFYYNYYTYLKDINRIKPIVNYLGFTFKKGGIVGISSRNTPDQRVLDKNEIIDAIKKYENAIEKLDNNNIDKLVSLDQFFDLN